MKKVRKKTLKYLLKVIDIAFLGYFYLVRMLSFILPPRVLYAIYSELSFILYHAVPGTGKRYRRIIAEALPEINDPDRIKYIARRSYTELYMGMVDLAVFARHGNKIARELEIEGLDIAERELRREDGGGIAVAGHLGGWAIAMGIMSYYGYLSTPIVVNPASTPTPRLVRAVVNYGQKIKAADGAIFTGDDATGKTLELLKQPKKILVITGDVMGGTILDLLGKPAAMASGMGHFVMDSGAPMIPVFVLRKKGGPLKFQTVIREKVDYPITGDRDKDIHAIGQAALDAIEKQIRLTPEQWTQWGALERWWNRADKLQKRTKE
jgi:Kdo2-lipid IVA lauroyltransferase/acyltransferase